MPMEFERKFVVKSEAWRAEVDSQIDIEQRYLAVTGESDIRVRRANDDFLLTIKGWQVGHGRPEWEFVIPGDSGGEVMTIGSSPVTKTRYLLARTPYTWTIDVFSGDSAGLTLLEVESDAPIEDLDLPAWVLAEDEVTDDQRYRNSYLSEQPFTTWENSATDVRRLRDPRLRLKRDEGRSLEDWRTEAQTDIDRIWYAPEFRRLSGITQVVPPQTEYVFHDRLLHSIKVAQVAATLARMAHYRARTDQTLRQQIADSGLRLRDWIDPDYCYAAGLAHDIGHPPYGHAGEHELQQMHEPGQIFASNNKRSFEGNAQSTRIVSILSFRKVDQKGLNLTLRTLAAIAKYPWQRGGHPHAIDKLKKKWSFYDSEKDVRDALEAHGFIRTVMGAGPSKARTGRTNEVVAAVHRWPEAEIMDWADDISYAVHDVEDFFRAGKIPLHRIAAALDRAPDEMKPLSEEDEEVALAAWAKTDFGFAHPDEEVQNALLYAREKMEKLRGHNGEPISEYVPTAFVRIMQRLFLRMPNSRFNGTLALHAGLQNFGSHAITLLTDATTVEVVDVDGDRRLQFRVDPSAQLVAEFFKSICKYYVINTAAVSTMQRGQSSSLQRLCKALYEQVNAWVDGDGADPAIHTLPARLKEYVLLVQQENHGTIDDGDRISAIVDYVCGLRDAQATILEARLSGDLSSLNVASDWLDA